jgi:hypothetical protein
MIGWSTEKVGVDGDVISEALSEPRGAMHGVMITGC